jgi:hypothetical protein
MDAATDPPLAFTLVLWTGAFFAMVWGFRVVFMRLSGGAGPFAPDDSTAPAPDEVTLEEPGPDRS